MVGLSRSSAGSEVIDEHVCKLIKGHSRLHIPSLPFYILARAPLGLEFHRTQLALPACFYLCQMLSQHLNFFVNTVIMKLCFCLLWTCCRECGFLELLASLPLV
ncbi:hypothetical protein SLEP1_g12158 [Rubroshorea leprosula]|nr:hypothetical protein SLEP1_g12158 [Rubroshorea leprosula]